MPKRYVGKYDMKSLFKTYWAEYSVKTIEERREYFDALSPLAKKELVQSFFDEGWFAVFMQNLLDHTVDRIKRKYKIDLIDLRIKAVKHRRTFLIDKPIWDEIESELHQYADRCNLDVYFGGLLVESWGRKKQYYRIRAHHNKWR